jgi:hypothetical protein
METPEQVARFAPKPQEAELEHQPPPLGNFQYVMFETHAKRLVEGLMTRDKDLGAYTTNARQNRKKELARSECDSDESEAVQLINQLRGSAVDSGTGVPAQHESEQLDLAARSALSAGMEAPVLIAYVRLHSPL